MSDGTRVLSSTEAKLCFILETLGNGNGVEVEHKALLLGLSEYVKKLGINEWYDEFKRKTRMH